jgi:hypothetical protein
MRAAKVRSEVGGGCAKDFINSVGSQPKVLATQEAEIRRIVVQSQPRQIIHKTLIENTQHE